MVVAKRNHHETGERGETGGGESSFQRTKVGGEKKFKPLRGKKKVTSQPGRERADA